MINKFRIIRRFRRSRIPFLSAYLQRTFMQKRYRRIARRFPQSELIFMNYGYAETDNSSDRLSLSTKDEPNRYHIQLYDCVIDDIDLEGLEVLEVGSGRGGGCDYIMRYLHPRKTVGVDLLEEAISICNNVFASEDLHFIQGDAESLPGEDSSFDVVINIESSHTFSSLGRFYREVYRVLRPGGWFAYADNGSPEFFEHCEKELGRSGLTLVRRRDITLNVIKSLRLDNDRKIKFWRSSAKNDEEDKEYDFFANWAGMVGSKNFESFCSGQRLYHSYLLQKVK